MAGLAVFLVHVLAGKVFNLIGQAVIDRDIDGKLTLTLPSGMYLVRLVNGTINETRKVVVEYN